MGNFDSRTARAFFYIKVSGTHVWYGFSMRRSFLVPIVWLNTIALELVILQESI
jgi:hypothetical protein